MIDCVELHKSFGHQRVLRGLNLSVSTGQITVVIGRSGEGKSVFLKHLIGLYHPDSGQILIDGRDFAAARGDERRAIKDQFAIVFQSGALFDSLNVFDNVAFPLRYKSDLAEAEIKDLVEEMLASVGLEEAGSNFLSEISGGMAKRVALARALVLHPRIILFDEPLTALDPVVKRTIIELIAASHERYGFTAVIVSHNIPEVFDLADHVAMLSRGRIVAFGRPEEINASKDREVRFFLNGGRED